MSSHAQDPAGDDRQARLAEVRARYEACRYLDAYALTEAQWRRPPRTVVDLSVDEAVMASRLAARLGSGRFCRALLRYAEAREPEHPLVRMHRGGPRRSLLEALQDFERRPLRGEVADDLRTAWLASHASAYALVRDFSRAEALLREAAALTPDDWYLACHRSMVAHLRERWDESLEHAEAAWARTQGHPAAANALDRALRALGRGAEGAARLMEAAERGQSFEVLVGALQATAREAVRSAGPQRQSAGHALMRAAEPLERLAPLADHQAQRLFARIRAHAIRMTGDRTGFEEHARRSGSGFLVGVADNLGRPGVVPHRVVLEHPRVQQRHDTCVPASIATCLQAQGEGVDADALAKALTYGGTAVWQASRWAIERGYVVRCFTLDLPSARGLLDAGIPFVAIFNAESIGHACAVVGLDVGEGTLLLHDPAHASPVEFLLEEVAQAYAPLGVLGVAIMPAGPAEAVAELPLTDERTQTLRVAVEEALAGGAFDRAAQVVEASDDEDDPRVEYARALVWSAQGDNRRALAALEGLGERFPRSRRLQGALEREAAFTRNAAQQERVLRRLLSGSPDPLHDPVAALRGSSPVLVSRYAELLSRTAERQGQAEHLLLRTLGDAPGEAELYQVLAELWWNAGRREDALLPRRIAACLAPTHDGVAAAYAWALTRVGRADEAVAWLRDRVAAADSAAATAGPVLTTVELLVALGDPGAAVDLLRVARDRRPDHGELAAAAAPVFARMGYADDAARAQAVAARAASPGERAACDTQLARVAGDLAGATEHAARWLSAEPTSLAAREAVLRLLESQQGSAAALARVRAWMADAPGDGGLQTLLVDLLRRTGDDDALREFLAQSLERDPHDAWARREQLVLDLRDARRRGTPDPEQLGRLEAMLDRCVADAPRSSVTLTLEAELLLLRGRRDEAIATFERACLEDPHYAYALTRRVELAPSDGEHGGQRLLEFLDRVVAGARTYDLSVIAASLVQVGSTVGLHRVRAAVARWVEQRPDDPHLLEAAIDLEMGDADRSALEALVPRLREVVAHHPYHQGLRLSLAWLFDRLDREHASRSEYEALCEDFRGDAGLRATLAMFLRRRGDAARAREALDAAIALAPRGVDYRLTRAQWYRDEGQPEAALAMLEEVARIDPVASLTAMVSLLVDLGRAPEAIERCEHACARPGAPPQVVTLTARVLCSDFAGGRVDRARELLAGALEREPNQWEVVSEYASLALRQGEPDEAQRAVEAYLPLAEDPIYARGELLRIEHVRGHHRAAIDGMQALVQERPDYRFGWHALTEWLEQRRSWKRLLAVLDQMPDFLRGTADAQLQRVRLLRRAGAKAAEVRQAVEELARANPHSVQVRGFVYDWYAKREEWDAAEAALLGGGRGSRDDAMLDPPLLARAVGLRAASGREDEAIASARALWRRGEACDADSADLALAGLARAELSVRACEALGQDWSEGGTTSASFSRRAVTRWADLGLIEPLEALGRALWASPDPDALDLLSSVVESLAQHERHALIEALLREDPSRVRGDRSLWAAVGLMHMTCGRYDDAHQWFAGWQERDDVPMYVLANIASTALQMGHLREAAEVANRALTERTPDGGHPFAARALYAALLCLGRRDEFLDAWRRFGPAEGESARAQALRYIARVLEQPRPPDELEALAFAFGKLDLASCDQGLRERWLEVMREQLSGPRRAKVRMRLWFDSVSEPA